VSGKPEPYANTMRSSVISHVNKGCSFVLIFRTKHGRHAVAAAQRFAQMNRPVNGIANAQTCIPPSLTLRLASVEAEITQVVTLADPRPDAEPDRPVPVLPVRMMREEER
jgi:hypothetical protein